MCKQIKSVLLLLIFSTILQISFAIPTILQTGISTNNGARFDDTSNSAVSSQEGITNVDSDAGFNKLYSDKASEAALNTRYGERANTVNNHLDAKQHQAGGSFSDNGVQGAALENKTAHKKGHHKQGFHNSYHKDETGSNSSFFDDGETEGGQHVFKNNQGSYANAAQDSNRGDHLDSVSYDNQKAHEGRFSSGENFQRGLNNVRNHDRNRYFEDRRNVNERNAGKRYGVEDNYHKEIVPFVAPIAPVVPVVPDQRRRITVYEDPRYEEVPFDRYHDDYVELDVRPARQRPFNQHYIYY